jgi:N-methylhydantoinase B/oxoprolinase/acetone carboxylase alpha subunit
MQASILSNHRVVPPFGLDGGEPGAVGVNSVERANGETEALAGTATIDLQAGDTLVIKTPGGGAFGKAAG